MLDEALALLFERFADRLLLLEKGAGERVGISRVTFDPWELLTDFKSAWCYPVGDFVNTVRQRVKTGPLKSKLGQVE